VRTGRPDIDVDHSQALHNDARKVEIVAADTNRHILGRVAKRSTLRKTICVTLQLMTTALIDDGCNIAHSDN
jgi:hypothetical protein